MRIAFAGSPAPAVPVLHALAASDHDVVLVISQPDRRRGRAGVATPTPVAAAAGELGLQAIRPASINDEATLALLRDRGAEALCVAAFGQILRDGVLGGWPCINVHYSLLPAYRGAAPVERAIMDGLSVSGVTIMEMEAGLDTGPIISSEEVAIGPDEDAGSVVARMAEVGGRLLVAAVDDLAAGRLASRPQPEEGVSLAPKITEEDRTLDPGRAAVALADRVRALSPHIGAVLDIDGRRFKIWRAAAREEPAPAGLTAAGARLLLGCGDGALEILELQAPSRGRAAGADFLRGWRGPLELRG